MSGRSSSTQTVPSRRPFGRVLARFKTTSGKEIALIVSGEHTGGSEAKSLTREELYDLAWREPMLRVAERFGVSSSYLARVFTELNVPRPAPGYWAQREFGKSPPKPDLPPARPGDITEWCPGASVGTAVRSLARAARTAKRIDAERGRPFGESRPARKPRDRTTTVSSKPHELLAGVKPQFLKTRKVENGILRPFKRLLVDMLSSEAKLDDALGAAQSLFDALEKRGFDVGFAPAGERMSRAEVELLDKPINRNHHRTRWTPDRLTVAYVGETVIGLTLFEMTEEVETVYVSGKYTPVRDLSEQQLRRYTPPHHWRSKEEYASGRLCLQAYCPHYGVKWSQRWQETKPGSLRSMVTDIVDALETMAPNIALQVHEAKLRAEDERRQWEEEHRRWQAEEERQRLEKANKESRDELLAAIASWEEARRVRDYLASVEDEIGRLPEDEAVHIRERLELCRELVGKLDPLALLRTWKAPNERLAAKARPW